MQKVPVSAGRTGGVPNLLRNAGESDTINNKSKPERGKLP